MGAYRLARRERPRYATAALQLLDRAGYAFAPAPCFVLSGTLLNVTNLWYGTLVTMVSQLAAAGARHIVVISLPDLGRIPYASRASTPSPATLTRYSRQFTRRLAQDLAATGLKYTLIDSFSILRSV